VQLLEHRRGFQLFERDYTGVRLTGAGRHFFEEAIPGVSQIDRAAQIAASTHRLRGSGTRPDLAFLLVAFFWAAAATLVWQKLRGRI
jgi:DNA-binding transcriptional LysR family regulator